MTEQPEMTPDEWMRAQIPHGESAVAFALSESRGREHALKSAGQRADAESRRYGNVASVLNCFTANPEY